MPGPRPVVPLTTEQSALASKWLPLCHKIAAEFGQDTDVTFEAICRAARGFDPSRGWTFQAFATRILKNACVDELRKKRHVELLPFEESLHSAAAGCADILGERDSLPEPVRPWTPPPDPVERPPRPAGTSRRSVQRRARAEGKAAPRGRPGVLTDRVLAAVLSARPGITTAALAEALGVSPRTLQRYDKNRQSLRRLRRGGAARIFGNGATPDRAAQAGDGASAPAAPRWQ